MDRIRSFDELLGAAECGTAGKPPFRVVLTAAEDSSSLKALDNAMKLGCASPVVVGDEGQIREIMERAGIDPKGYVFHDVSGQEAKAERSVELIRNGEAEILMKGMLPTSAFLGPLFNRGTGLITGNFVSHTGVLEVPGYGRLLLQTDGAINIQPDIEKKKGIIKNAVFVAHLLGIERPKVALLSATEKVHPRIPSTVEAAELVRWAGEAVPDAIVEGPLAFDLAISPDAAMRKGLTSPVAGEADILVAANIEMGNVIYKSLRHFAKAEGAGIVVGATCPVILTSRSDPPQEKLNSLALASLHAARISEAGYTYKKP